MTPPAFRPLDEQLLGSTALDSCIACVGTTGSGKTYAMKTLAERLLALGHRVCVIDPLGVWWGLRAAADGGPGPFDLRVFGGLHADVPLAEGQGAALGRLVAGRDLSCVVDISELGSKAARRRFMQDFLAALYELNREPLHLIVDEADLFAPQKPQPDGLALLGLVDEIVRRGRIRGFIPWLITQRPAVLAKDVLSQAAVLLALKLTSAQDRNAIGAWIEGQADKADEKAILAALPGLQRGEAWLWAPGLELLERVAIPQIRTFDSSRTPKRGERVPLPALSPVDVAGLAEALAAPAAKKAARKAAPSAEFIDGAPMPDAAELERIVAAARDAGHTEGYRDGYQRGYDDGAADLCNKIAAAVGSARDSIGKANFALMAPPAAPTAALQPTRTPVATAPPEAKKTKLPKPAPTGAGGSLNRAAQQLLRAFVIHHPQPLTWQHAAVLAGVAPHGGYFNGGRKQLVEGGLVEEADRDALRATATGLSVAGPVDRRPQPIEETVALWKAKLKGPAPQILDYLLANRFAACPYEAIATALGIARHGGYWNAGMKALRTNNLAVLDRGTARLDIPEFKN